MVLELDSSKFISECENYAIIDHIVTLSDLCLISGHNDTVCYHDRANRRAGEVWVCELFHVRYEDLAGELEGYRQGQVVGNIGSGKQIVTIISFVIES